MNSDKEISHKRPPGIRTYWLPPPSSILPRIPLKKLVVSRWKMENVGDGVAAMHRLGRMLNDHSMAVLARAGIVNAEREHDTLLLRRETDQAGGEVFTFHSQAGKQPWLDRFGPSGKYGEVGVQLVTLGQGAVETGRRLDREQSYQDLFLWHGLCAELVEAFADECQRILGALIGKKPGRRFSFGFPGTPGLDQHSRFAAFVGGAEIDVRVTESGMLDPEFSTSAVVLWTDAGDKE